MAPPCPRQPRAGASEVLSLPWAPGSTGLPRPGQSVHHRFSECGQPCSARGMRGPTPHWCFQPRGAESSTLVTPQPAPRAGTPSPLNSCGGPRSSTGVTRVWKMVGAEAEGPEDQAENAGPGGPRASVHQQRTRGPRQPRLGTRLALLLPIGASGFSLPVKVPGAVPFEEQTLGVSFSESEPGKRS